MRFLKGGALVLAASLAGGCAGVRTGYFSEPYTGDPPQRPGPRTAYERSRRNEIPLPGLKLKVDLLNNVQVSDSIWFGIGIPMVPVRVRHPRPPAPGTTCLVQVRFEALEPGLAFDPARARLVVDGTSHTPTAFQPYLWSTGRWESVASAPLDAAPDRDYKIELHFATPRPRPGQDILLDLGPAIRHPGLDPFPIIHFRKQKWREFYS